MQQNVPTETPELQVAANTIVCATIEESEIAVRISTRDLQFAVDSGHCICSGEYLRCSKYGEDPFWGARFEFLLVR
jgi:hypothetical protein